MRYPWKTFIGEAEVDSKHRQSKLLQKKVSQPLLILTSISSLDDAIDFSNSGASPLLATYFFANLASAKYLSQFIDSYLSLVNHIPAELLGQLSLSSSHKLN